MDTYEKKYNEALERAKKQRADYQKELDKTDKNSQLAGLLRAGISAIDMAFPELRESEDERIRKAILIYLDWLDGRKDCQPKGDYTIRDMIAYLEKQKEQNPAEWSEEDEGMLKRIIERIEAEIQYGDALTMAYGNQEIAWLKFLRTRLNAK